MSFLRKYIVIAVCVFTVSGALAVQVDVIIDLDRDAVHRAVIYTRKSLQETQEMQKILWSITEEQDVILLQSSNRSKLSVIRETFYSQIAKNKVPIQNVIGGKTTNSSTPSDKKFEQELKLVTGIDANVADKIINGLQIMHNKVHASHIASKVNLDARHTEDLDEAIRHVRQLDLPVLVSFTNFRQ